MPKALVELGGLPLVLHAARRLAASGVVDGLVVTAPAGLAAVVTEVVARDPHIEVPVRVVEGGATRQASVATGLRMARAADDVVLVHDAARPLVPPSLVRRVVEAVRSGHRAVVPGLPVTDTIKQVIPGPGAELVVGTPDRSLLRAVQTPQGFERGLLVRAHEAGAVRAAAEHLAATDDAGLVEALGEKVHIVPGDDLAFKITTERDLWLAELVLQEAA
ncbi:2-C-methyl-D-erythritol 4-phosphate cytidylyltransferase [Antribacter soli]|uniref:2-C-methyl-D-erythritol 4-phosphate cytidylyltransferase n=1 Tax=Antribacter soli TaxID=2910976 RepID=UPI0027DF0994|nr:2-C-methyl-D-erythritol 4-phosphate cytidylyltransferase [Antribacter soli]